MFFYNPRMRLYLGLVERQNGGYYFIRFSLTEKSTGYWREQVSSKEVVQNYMNGSADRKGFREITERAFDQVLQENIGLLFMRK